MGYYEDSAGVDYGFLDNGGVYTSIDYPGAWDTGAYGINDAGEIVGYYASYASVPEPATALFLSIALLGLVAFKKKLGPQSIIKDN